MNHLNNPQGNHPHNGHAGHHHDGHTSIVGHQGSGAGPGPQVMASDSLEGDRVVNARGENIGKIRDIMIDVPTGRVAYAVLSFGGVMGIGSKLFAVPWSALTLDTDNKCFVMDIDKERLENAPGFDKDDWPNMADPQFANSIHQYYDRRPYWQ